MIKKIRKKLITILLGAIIIFLAIGITLGAFYGKVWFQEGNPIPLLTSIVKLEFSNDNFVQYSTTPEAYISKSKGNRQELIEGKMGEKDWILIDQMGNAYFFEKKDERKVVTTRQYTRRYFVWEVEVEG
ncbi:cytochrome c-type biogenesis protein CcmE [Evansella vedderi]|uniref:Cytochrome c-type biogenesis protein CcmE n=1 Tax=Evansella vedderi TaxID=38282 RepID=A0ABU0A2K5_9BACI|nr:hypothetical protein [Evansella vedderi]MDQ0257721.1 cytochrome c-type biogenesis protein CcmE [Evansella vedderi]